MTRSTLEKNPFSFSAFLCACAGIGLFATSPASANFGGLGVESTQKVRRAPKAPARRIASDADRAKLIQALQENDLETAKRLIAEIPELQADSEN